jgi:hypothetical protein
MPLLQAQGNTQYLLLQSGHDQKRVGLLKIFTVKQRERSYTECFHSYLTDKGRADALVSSH